MIVCMCVRVCVCGGGGGGVDEWGGDVYTWMGVDAGEGEG